MSDLNPWGQYPTAAEAFWIQQAAQATERSEADCLDLMAPATSQLSDLFTTERPEHKFPDYFADDKLLAAYGLFFLPQSFVRTAFALAQITQFRGWRPPEGKIKILDLGCGPGSCGLSLAYHLRNLAKQEVEVFGLDHSPNALRGLTAWAQAGFSPSISTRTRLGDVNRPETWPEEKFSVIVAGFVLNELTQQNLTAKLEWIKACQSRLSPGGLLLILEPALRLTAEKLTELSDQITHHGIMHRLAPELDALPCPQLAQGEHWSYEARAWSAPSATAYINRKLHRDLREVRFSFAAFSNQPPSVLTPNLARVVSDIQIIKGLLRFITIRAGQLETVEVPTRGLSKHEIKVFAAGFSRGDIVAYDHPPSPKLRLTSLDGLKVIWTPK